MGKKVLSVGGAEIGWLYATWPLAVLSADEETLCLRVLMLGTYTFERRQVVSLQPYVRWGWGIRISHAIAGYPRHIVFRCLGRPRSLIKRIHEAGFTPEAEEDEALARRGMAVRWESLAAGLAVYCGLLFLDWVRLPGGHVGFLSLLAVLLLFAVTAGLWWSQPLQELVLKPGRELSEVQHWVGLLTVVSGLLSLFFAIELLARPR